MDLYSGTQMYPNIGSHVGTQVYPNVGTHVGTHVPGHFDLGFQSIIGHGAPVAAAPIDYGAPVGVVPGQHVALPAPAAPLAVAPAPLTVEEQIAKFSKVIAATSRLLSPNNNPFKRTVQIVDIKKEQNKTKVPVYSQKIVNGVPQYIVTQQEVSTPTLTLESVKEEVEEPRQLPNGQWVTVKVTVEKLKPKITYKDANQFFLVNGVPKGADPLEFAAEKGTLLSAEFVKAIKDLASSSTGSGLSELASAEYLAWGPKSN